MICACLDSLTSFPFGKYTADCCHHPRNPLPQKSFLVRNEPMIIGAYLSTVNVSGNSLKT
ncbi:hypothetical protein HanXRQr2_Chr09g0378941 [Helianthus annuus]|uniref:Uncharacterized protein n=1 Tax=Helianthus annuus TaxID=4232 RepID=A0A9K3N7M6_HELAN|nr:hypothetical protein HanXRQr2_Chr09g0378941 [Helianthus annuus]